MHADAQSIFNLCRFIIKLSTVLIDVIIPACHIDDRRRTDALLIDRAVILRIHGSPHGLLNVRRWSLDVVSGALTSFIYM